MALGTLSCAADPAGCFGDVAKKVLGDAIDNMANAVMEAYGKIMASLGTMWVHIGTPNLTETGGSSAIEAGSSAENSSNITMVLSYVMWISLGVAILSLFILGALIAIRMRAGEGIVAVGRVGLVLSSVVLIASASAIVAGVMPSEPREAGGTVLFLQSGLWWYMGAAAIASVIIGGARMAWEQRAEPGRETVKSLLTLVVVAGAGVSIIGLLVTAADSFAIWIIDSSLDCHVAENGACFGKNMLMLLALTTHPATGGLGALLIIILGLLAILAAAFQIVLMVARGGMLVILAGILPLSASFTNTEMGKTWFKKCIAWLVAFILYKPAAAIVYAAAFQLVGTNVFSDDGTGLLAVLTGLMLMVIALIAMPALMRFVAPMVGAMSGGAGDAVTVGAMAALPSGAAAVGRLAYGNGLGSSPSSSPSGSDGRTGAQGSPGPSGSGQSGGANASQQAQSSGAQQAGNTSGGTGAGSVSGGATSSTGAAAASASGGAGAATGAGAGGGAAASGAAVGGGATAAGAAAGPVGLAVGAAVEVGTKAGQAAAVAAQNLGEQSTSAGSGPDGSR